MPRSPIWIKKRRLSARDAARYQIRRPASPDLRSAAGSGNGEAPGLGARQHHARRDRQRQRQRGPYKRERKSDLFWALRGGGGNFGDHQIDFKLHATSPRRLVRPHPRIPSPRPRSSCRARRIVAEAPDELTVWTVMRMSAAAALHPGGMARQGRSDLRVLLSRRHDRFRAGDAARPATSGHADLGRHLIATNPSPAAIRAFLFCRPGSRNYWKSHDFADLSGAAIKTIVDAVECLPSPECEVFIAHVGGAMGRVAPDAMAWSNREAHFVMNAHTRWRDPAQDDGCIAWAQRFSTRSPHSRREASM